MTHGSHLLSMLSALLCKKKYSKRSRPKHPSLSSTKTSTTSKTCTLAPVRLNFSDKVLSSALNWPLIPTSRNLAYIIIKKSTSSCCQLCKDGDEDTVHFLAKCPPLKSHRQTQLNKLQRLDIPQKSLAPFQLSDPLSFTAALLLPYDMKADSHHRQSVITATLSFLYSIHSARAAALSSASSYL